MSFCFQPFNYSSHISCCLSRHVKKNPSSTLSPFEGNTNSFSKSSSDTSFAVPRSAQANGIGIIGGVSVDSTLDFAKKLVDLQLKNEGSSPPFILCSDPHLSNVLSSIERASFPSVSPKTQHIQSDYAPVVENLRHKRAFLEKSGVYCIAMPCHVSHSWYEEIEEGCSVPFLHVGECVAKELKEAKFRPLEAGSPLRIGVLSTNQTLVPRFYQEKLENEGFEVILPDKATMEHTVIPAVEALNREDFEGAQNLFRIALQVLLVRAVNRVILASDELKQLLPKDDPLWSKCIDPMDSLARSSIKIARFAETASQQSCFLSHMILHCWVVNRASTCEHDHTSAQQRDRVLEALPIKLIGVRTQPHDLSIKRGHEEQPRVLATCPYLYLMFALLFSLLNNRKHITSYAKQKTTKRKDRMRN